MSTYNYAENSPIANIDLHGLQAVSVHGVKATAARLNDNSDLIDIFEDIAGNSESDRSFNWAVPRNADKPNKMLNGLFPSDQDLTTAAEMLVEHVKKVRTEKDVPKGEHVTIIAFSGGGPVGILAAKNLADEGLTVNVITLNSPAASEGSKFHPSGGGINDGVFLHTKGDAVPGRWLRGFKKKFKKNSLDPQFEQHQLKSTAKDPISKHSANNVDREALKKLNLSLDVPKN